MNEIGIAITAVCSLAAFIGAVVTLGGYIHKVSKWVDNQERQDEAIEAIKDEQCLIVYGTLACLKGLKEQGCNGPVTDAINKIEKHINVEAHK